jgi:hypothetical protein
MEQGKAKMLTKEEINDEAGKRFPPFIADDLGAKRDYNEISRLVFISGAIYGYQLADCEYWKKRCEAAEAVIDKFAAIPLHPDVTESGKTIFKQWQELKSTPIPILTPCGGWIDGNILPKEPGLYVCICEENKDGIKTQRATFGEFRLHYDKIFVNEDLYGKVIKWYNDESPSPSDRERIDYWQKLYSESESKLSDAKTEIERLKGFIAEVAIFHHDANPSKLIEKARKLI